MKRWDRFISAVAGDRILVVLGCLFVVVAAGRSILMAVDNTPFTTAMIEFLLTGGPWLLVLYGGYRLPNTELHSDVYPRIVAWCLGGFGVLLVVLSLVQITSTTGIDRPLFSGLLATGLGSAGGFGMGVHDARSLSRAREAERRRDELRQERNLRDRIVETSPVGIAIVDPDGTVSFANEHAADIVGLTEEELTGLRYDEPMFMNTDGDGDSSNDSLFEHILSTAEGFYTKESQMTRADGRRVWLSVNGTPLHDQAGELTSVIFAFEDITERKEYERELEESNERLEQFAYAASHDLQEPLRMVSSYLQLIETRYEEELDEDGQEFVEFAVDGAERMKDMIEGLLEYSRIENQGDPFEPVDLNDVLEDAHTDLQLQIEESDASIDVGELPRVQGDASQLRQVFENLLSNAIEYSGDEPPRVHVSAQEDSEEWTISVQDEGIGIEPDDADRIFEVFQRLHSHEEYEGTGIGLALCTRIVERHGGEMWVESEPGEGSTFYFTLLQADEDREPQSTSDPARG